MNVKKKNYKIQVDIPVRYQSAKSKPDDDDDDDPCPVVWSTDLGFFFLPFHPAGVQERKKKTTGW